MAVGFARVQTRARLFSTFNGSFGSNRAVSDDDGDFRKVDSFVPPDDAGLLLLGRWTRGERWLIVVVVFSSINRPADVSLRGLPVRPHEVIWILKYGQ